MKCLGSLNYISSVSRPVYHKSRAKKRGRKRGGGWEGERGGRGGGGGVGLSLPCKVVLS